MSYLLLGFVALLLLSIAAKLLLGAERRHRSAGEVASILSQFSAGAKSPLDDFLQVPIADPALDRIRQRFAEVCQKYPRWEPPAPFPEDGRSELQALIAAAEALERAVRTAV